MRGFLSIALAVPFLSGCAIFNTGEIDEQGTNGMERTLQGVVGFPARETDSETPVLATTPEVKPVEVAKLDRPPAAIAVHQPNHPAILQLDDDLSAETPVPSIEDLRPVERFPAAQPPHEALKKYMALKNSPEEEKPLIPVRKTMQYADADKVAFKEKFPGVIIFLANDATFQTSSLDKLQELAIRLARNPNETVLFQAQASDGEAMDVVDRRFSLIREHLAKNFKIAPERLVLDDKKAVGDWPEFKMFILKLGAPADLAASEK